MLYTSALTPYLLHRHSVCVDHQPCRSTSLSPCVWRGLSRLLPRWSIITLGTQTHRHTGCMISCHPLATIWVHGFLYYWSLRYNHISISNRQQRPQSRTMDTKTPCHTLDEIRQLVLHRHITRDLLHLSSIFRPYVHQ